MNDYCESFLCSGRISCGGANMSGVLSIAIYSKEPQWGRSTAAAEVSYRKLPLRKVPELQLSQKWFFSYREYYVGVTGEVNPCCPIIVLKRIFICRTQSQLKKVQP